MPGHSYEKLRKQYQDTQNVPFILDKTRKPLISETKNLKKLAFFSFGKCRILPKTLGVLCARKTFRS